MNKRENIARQQRALTSPVARAIAKREALAMQATVRNLALACLYAAQLSLALEVSADVVLLDAAHAMAVAPGANALAADVRTGRVRMDAVDRSSLKKFSIVVNSPTEQEGGAA